MALTHGGGKPYCGELSYSTPRGPTEQQRRDVGLGGENTGNNNNTVPARQTSGSPGLGGTNHGNNPSRGG